MPTLKRRSNDAPTFDWTRDTPPSAATEYQQRVRANVDWVKSPLGPMGEWPAALRQMVLLCMADSSPSAVLYGPVGETAIVYNEDFASLIGNKHPKLQGQIIGDELDDLCPTLQSVWKQQAVDGHSQTVRNQRVRQDWLGFVEEKTYSWKFVPIIDGVISGSLITVEDETKAPPRRVRSKSAVRELGNVMKNAIDHTAKSALKLDEHFSGRSCNCEKLWQAAQQMEHNKAKYEKFADYAPVGIVELDTSHQVQWANKAYYDVTGSVPRPSETVTLLDYIHPDDADRVRTLLDMGAFREGAFTFECRLKKWASRPAISPSDALPQSSPAWILVSAYREADQEQNTMCWIIDITAHKSAEDFLRKRMDEALELKRQKERFIDLISHEIRNPLSAMMHCIDDLIELTRHEKESEVAASAETIRYCTQHIKNIVGDVLTLSKVESRLVDICVVPTSPVQTVGNALKIFHGELRSSGIELIFEKDSSLEDLDCDWLLLDPNRMLQVLINVVTNAIKVLKARTKRVITVRLGASLTPTCLSRDGIQFVQPRGNTKAVDFGAQQCERSVFLVTTVEDTGPGLDQDEMMSLFERFAQANPKTESKYGGSGLGLFITRDLTELQGGRVGIASTPGVGSKVFFSIETKPTTAPASPPEPPSIEIPARLRNPSIEFPQVATLQAPLHGPDVTRKDEQSESRRAGRRVLVVEDNAINQKVLANQLRKRGCQVGTATNGEEALEQLHMSPKATPVSVPSPSPPPPPPEEQAFDVVLMDLEMPVMDGLTCARRIREFEARHAEQRPRRPRRRRLPIIAVTANARSEHGAAAWDVGMDALTTKPYRVDDLVAQIEELCSTDT